MKRVAAILLVPLLAACGTTDAGRSGAAPADGQTPSTRAPVEDGLGRTGPLGGDAAASCRETYSVATIGNRDVAFDGTVLSIGPGTTNWPGEGRGDLDLASVTRGVAAGHQVGPGQAALAAAPSAPV